MSTVFTLGELFCGPGGLAWGAMNADVPDMKIVHAWANDYDLDTCKTYIRNICPEAPDSVYCEDVHTLDIEKLVGMHNYYCMATHVSGDFSEIAFRAVGKANGMNHNSKFLPMEKQGVFTSLFLKERYGKSKRCRWIKGRVIVPVSYVQHVYPKFKRRDVNKYLPKYTDNANCVSFDVMKYMMENADLFPNLEMADNALSRYIAQKGKCAILHTELVIGDMRCLHIKHPKGERNDTYKNLILVSYEMARVITSTDKETLAFYLRGQKLTSEMQEKINKLRGHRGLEPLQFKDYTDATN